MFFNQFKNNWCCDKLCNPRKRSSNITFGYTPKNDKDVNWYYDDIESQEIDSKEEGQVLRLSNGNKRMDHIGRKKMYYKW